MRTLDALILDLDGVLADSEPVHARAWEDVLPPAGIPCPDGWFIPWVGIPDTIYSNHLRQQYPHIDTAALLKGKRAAFARRIDTDLTTFPGMREALDALPLPQAVATSSCRNDAHHMLSVLGMLERFRVVICWEDVEAHKPEPEPFIRAAERLGVAPGNSAAIEDSPTGVAAALAAGCLVIGVTTTHPAADLDGAHLILPTPAEAVRWVRGHARATETAPNTR